MKNFPGKVLLPTVFCRIRQYEDDVQTQKEKENFTQLFILST